MSLDLSGAVTPITPREVKVEVLEKHPLIILANCLPWDILIDLVVKDLKSTTQKGFWWLGRKIIVRLHLAVFLLQKLYNLTDRKMEYTLKDNAAYQLFSGIGVVNGWYPPDHTSIEDFRNRLTPETQQALANELAKAAVTLGFGDPSETDFDSTVQEANISYPSDASLMTKLAEMGKKIVDFLKGNIDDILPIGVDIDLKEVKEKAREYFFLAKNTAMDKRREVFQGLHKFVKKQMYPLIDMCEALSPDQIKKMPWNIRSAVERIKTNGRRYILDVAHFIHTHTIKSGKLLSWHAKAIACIKKGKIGKNMEFGRVFQLGRIKGNFLFVLQGTDIQMNDKKSFPELLKEHTNLFGEGVLKTVAVDKGYWSGSNRKSLQQLNIATEGLQKPSNIKSESNLDACLEEHLRNRRAGIEPLIGHVKNGGQMGKSKMKSDTATLAAGYGSVLGFNLRQMIRHQQGKLRKVA